MEPIIEFKDFSYKYRAQKEPTLKNINLKIYKGEKILIVGPSGSGKSTLAKCINALIPSSYPGKITGEISVCKKLPSKEGIFGIAKHVGTVLQDMDSQFIGLTVGEDIAFALENECIPTDKLREKVQEAAKKVDVQNLLEQHPEELSGGQKQRVSMAGVLVDDVDILLFDEPLANLDPLSGKNTIALIDSINKNQGKTIIIIEHRLEDVLYKDVDRIIVMSKGEIVADTTPNEIFSTNILEETGIREPLYIAAIKHAGCNILKASKAENIESLDITPYKNKLISWFTHIEKKEIPIVNENILELKNVAFSYDGKKNTVETINFAIKKGEMVSIVGKNGAGKTTISSLICGFINPSSGSILLENKDISALSIKERGEKIGIVMQNPNQMISKNMIFDEVALGLTARNTKNKKLISKKEIEDRVNETLKICGLYPFRKWPVNTLSFGQKKRVTIASILVLKPKIIILDEPTAGQDFKHYTEIMEFLEKLNRENGITIIMITHDMHLMLEYTRRAIVLADGHIIADDKSSSILTDEDIANKASLKKTSLYDLAIKCSIENPTDFVDRFISYERTFRNTKQEI